MIKIWEEQSKPQYFLRLCEALDREENAARLVITDPNGARIENGTILLITQNGNLKLLKDISSDAAEDMGLQLDTDGRIVVANDDD